MNTHLEYQLILRHCLQLLVEVMRARPVQFYQSAMAEPCLQVNRFHPIDRVITVVRSWPYPAFCLHTPKPMA